MPPCGNFGLLLLGKSRGATNVDAPPLPAAATDPAAAVTRLTMRSLAETGGLVLPRPTAVDSLDVSLSSDSRVSVSSKSSRDNLLESPSLRPSTGIKPSMSSRYSSLLSSQETQQLLPPLQILENMTAATEVRGGQAGGYSIVEHSATSTLSTPVVHRVRLVARKRVPLAADLTRQYLRETGGHNPNPHTASLTCIGHTRFATSSINVVPELHPHEWTPWRVEQVWRVNAATGRFTRGECLVGCHITHNGDFDALDAYSSKMTNGEVGLWLERILHVPNNTRGDSPKLAGMMDLLRVQGRWAAAARLAWVKTVCMQALDVTGGQQLEKSAANNFPKQAFFDSWALLLEAVWAVHKDTMLRANAGSSSSPVAYSIDVRAEKQFVNALVQALDSDDKCHLRGPAMDSPAGTGMASFLGPRADKTPAPRAVNSANSGDLVVDVEQGGASSPDSPDSPSSKQNSAKNQPRFRSFSLSPKADPSAGMNNDEGSSVSSVSSVSSESSSSEASRDDNENAAGNNKNGLKHYLKAQDMSPSQARNFFTTAVRGFLRADVYSAVVEFLARAEGSFGLQVHSSAEPGVVVIASRGQPMSLSFDPLVPMVLFGSEAGALGVPVDRTGKWLSRRIDLDNAGEIVRVGSPRVLDDGTFTSSSSINCLDEDPFHLMLQCGIQLCSYSLADAGEARLPQLLARITHVSSTVRVFDPKIDLVRSDLTATPLVLSTIDRTWARADSLEHVAASSLGAAILDCMRERLSRREETTDLVISGVEASLWLAESFAADLRGVFPGINVITLSSNKLLGLGLPRAGIVYFPGSIVVEEEHLSSKTCFLLVSQSGQTFPALHSTSITSRYLQDQRLWLMTATFNSRMEKVIRDDHATHGKTYENDRVINVLCGHRPAEPSSVVVAATWHTLSRLLLFLAKYSQQNCPEGCATQPWNASRDESSSNVSSRTGSGDARPPVPMALSRGCVEDLDALFDERLVHNVAEIVGAANENQAVHAALVKQGVAWGSTSASRGACSSSARRTSC